jgi:hypothetical protein
MALCYAELSRHTGTRFATVCCGGVMPEKDTLKRAQRDKRQGKSASTQAGEFVREEMHHIREGKHGAKNTKQAIAIGLSKARRSGVKLGAPPRGSKPKTKQSAKYARRAAGSHRKPSARRSRAILRALRREGHRAASRRSLARQARSSARRRSASARSAAARHAARTKGARGRSAAARKAARTRKRHRAGA